MTILLKGDEFYRADRSTDLTKVIVVFAILRTRLEISKAPPPISVTAIWRQKSTISLICGVRNFENSFRTLGLGSLHFSHPLPRVLYLLHIHSVRCVYLVAKIILLKTLPGCRTPRTIASLCRLPCYIDQSVSHLAQDVELFFCVMEVENWPCDFVFSFVSKWYLCWNSSQLLPAHFFWLSRNPIHTFITSGDKQPLQVLQD